MCDKNDFIQHWYEKAEKSGCLSKLQLAGWLCGELSERENREQVLQIWAEKVYWMFAFPSNKKDDSVLEKRWEEWKKSYMEFFGAAVRLLGKRGVCKEQFYKELSDLIWNNTFFDEGSRAFALYYYLNCVYCPYFELEQGIAMENGEFRERLEQMNISVRQIRFIMQQTYEQRTQRASLINQVFETAGDERERAVLMSWFLNFMETREKE